MSTDDRRWRRQIEQLVRRGSTNGGGDPGEHNHAGQYAPTHGHPYAATAHNHDGSYSATGHTHNYEAAGAVVAHAGAGDPHPGYLTSAEGNAAYAATGHTHGGGSSPVTVQKVTADQSVTSTTLANATNMGFTVVAATGYEFEYLLAITSAALTTGWQFGFTGPASPVMWVAAQEYQSSATAWTSSVSSAITYPAFTLVTAAHTITAPILVRIKGVLFTGAAGGTLQLQFRTEVANSAITLKRASTLKIA